MIKKLMQWIFMDGKGRAAAKKLRESQAQIARTEAAISAAESDSRDPKAHQNEETGQAAAPSERDILLEQTMNLYRQRRAEYEQLDEGVRAKLTKLAGDQLGKKD